MPAEPDVTSRIDVRAPGATEPTYVAVAREGALARAGAAAWRLIGIGVLFVAGLWLVRQLLPVLLPAVIAVMLSTLLTPVSNALRRRGTPPALAAAAAVLLALLVVVLAVALIVPSFIDRIAALSDNVEQGLQELLYSTANQVAGVSRPQVDRAVTDALDSLNANRGMIVGGLLAGVSTLAAVAGAIVLVLFLAFFLVKDGARLWSWVVGVLPRASRATTTEFGERVWRTLKTYVRGVVFVATVDALFIGLGLVLVGVELVLPLMVLTFFAAFFPIVGAIGAGFVSVLVAFVSQGVGAAAVIFVVILVVQQVEGNILYPAVVGPRLKLHPIVVLLSVTLGGTVAGIPGAFLAVPVASVAAAGIELRRERLRDDADDHIRRGEALVLSDPAEPR